MAVQIDSTKSMITQDLSREHNFASFLDKCLYRPLEGLIKAPDPRCANVSFERIYDLPLQYQGIDIILHEGAWQTYIDEKSQLHNLNKDIGTFAFELSYLRKDGITEAGWLLNPRKKTMAYMLCWPFGVEKASGDEYRMAKVLLLSKVQLLSAISYYGYDRQELAIRDACVREKSVHGRYKTKCNEFWFFLSTQYAEQPINLVVREPFLKEISMAALNVEYDPCQGTSHINGNWIGQEINSTVQVNE